MKTYVAGLLFSPSLDNVVLIKKNKPAWMAGLWNGVGGSVEGYDPSHKYAMEREFEEETGLLITANQWAQFATLQTDYGEIAWYTAKAGNWAAVQTKESKIVCPHSRASILSGELPLMPNLLWLYEMARAFHVGKDRCNLHFVREVGYAFSG